MKLLLDTHIWLWSLLEPNRLSRRVRAALQDAGNELWVSPISTWEILVLCEKGRLTLDDQPESWIRRAMAAAPLREAPLTHEIAFAVQAVSLPHRDPADRFLAATATVLGLTLVTADEKLAQSRACPVLQNR